MIRWYIYALENFATNSTRLNHFIVSFLHRIAFGVVDLAPMLYQARLFRIFQKIIDNKVIRTLPETRELFDFAKFLLRKFFANAKKNPKIFTEILFWKRSKDCFEIEHGYGSYKYVFFCFILTKNENLILELKNKSKLPGLKIWKKSCRICSMSFKKWRKNLKVIKFASTSTLFNLYPIHSGKFNEF